MENKSSKTINITAENIKQYIVQHVDLNLNLEEIIDLGAYTKLNCLTIDLNSNLHQNVKIKNISSDEIYYIGLTNCSSNNFDVTKLPNKTRHLHLYRSKYSSNDLAYLPTQLKILSIFNINNYLFDDFIHLDNLPLGLERLIICDCNIQNLDNLPESLTHLECKHCNIKSLDNLPRGLVYLDCSYNDIIALNNLPDCLEELYCKSNKIESIDRLPNSLKRANCTFNPLISKPNCPKSTLLLNYSLDYEKASIEEKINHVGNKMVYGTYVTTKYTAYGIGIGLLGLGLTITYPFYYAYTKIKT